MATIVSKTADGKFRLWSYVAESQVEGKLSELGRMYPTLNHSLAS